MVDLSADCVTFVRTVVPTVALTVNFRCFDGVNYIGLFICSKSYFVRKLNFKCLDGVNYIGL